MCNPPSEFCRCQEICRDRPIYVRVACCGDDEQNCWYVIEEKPLEADSSCSSLFSSSSSSSAESSGSVTTSSDNDEEDCNKDALECKSESHIIRRISFGNDEEDCNNDVLECKSDSDIIRRISVPDFEVRQNSLAVLNSHIYLIGGGIDTARQEDDKNIGYKHIELGKSEWQLGGGNLLHEQYGEAVVGHDGFIYSVGCHQYQLSPKDGSLKRLEPPPKIIDFFDKDVRTVRYQSRVLAFTKEKLYIYFTAGASNLMFSYDLKNEEWDKEEYPSFLGLWSAGVVLYDRYLFSFGSQDPNSLCVTVEGEVRRVVPGVYVFDINQRRWLSEQVSGLQTSDGTVLPYDFQTNDYDANPDGCDNGPLYDPYLFQIGRQNDRKLALVWETLRQHPKSGLPQCVLIWSKFIITRKTNHNSDQDPQFYAGSLSKGSGALDEWTYLLLNCAAGM